MACNDRQLTEAQRQAGFQQQRAGVNRAIRPFSGSKTLENLIDYVNRELGPALRATRDACNDVFLQVADNAPSANPLAFYFSTSTAAADPTVGRMRLNQAVQNTATIIRVSESNGRLQSVQPWLDVMSGGPTTPLGTLTMVDAINPGRFLRFDLNTMTDQGAYWDLGVTIIESSDASPFVEDEPVVVGFIAGVSAAGSTVPVGSLSPVARDTFLGNIGTTTAPPGAVPLASVDSTSIVYDGTAHEFQRAALTGFATAAQNSNATSSAEPIVTYTASANMSAERVTTSSASVTVSTGVASQIEFQRAALTGEVTASANANATTVTRSTDFQVAPWTGSHSFGAGIAITGANAHAQWNAQQDNFALGAVSILRGTQAGNIDLTGMVPAFNGQLLIIKSSDSGDSLSLPHASGSSSAANQFDNPDDATVKMDPGGALLAYYDPTLTKWCPVLPNPGVGRLLTVTAYTDTSAGTGTHTFDIRASSYLVEILSGQGGGGGANSAAAEVAVGGQGGWGARIMLYVTTVPTSAAYTMGGAGTGGASTGADGGAGTNTVWDGVTISAGGGGRGSANATLGSASGTTLGVTAGGAGGVGATGSLPTGATVVMFEPGAAGEMGVRLTGTTGWGGGAHTSTLGPSNGQGQGALSSNNTDRAGAAGHNARIMVWEFS